MADPISLSVLLAGGTLFATGVGAAAATATAGANIVHAGHTVREDRKKRKNGEQAHQPHYQIVSSTEQTARDYRKGGNERVIFGSDGSITAVGHGPGDWSCGYSVTTRTINYGPGPSSGHHSRAAAPSAQPPVGNPGQYVSPYSQHAIGAPSAAIPYGNSTASMPQAMRGQVMQQQIMPSQMYPGPSSPPPSYAQSQKKHKKWF